MSWNAVKTWAFGDPWTVDDTNKYLRDDPQYTRDSIRFTSWSSRNMASWNNAASAVYADWGGANYIQIANFVKRQAATDLRFKYYGSCWLTVVGTARIGVKVGATDYDGRQFNFTVASNHDMVEGEVNVTGLAAGTYTATLRGKTVTGGGSITTDANDWMTMDLMEVSSA